MHAELDSFSGRLYNGQNDGVLPSWCTKSWSQNKLPQHLHIDSHIVQRGISRLKDDRTCSDDLVVAEMLRELPEIAIDE